MILIVLNSLGSGIFPRILGKGQVLFPEKSKYTQNLEYNFRRITDLKMDTVIDLDSVSNFSAVLS